MGYIEEESIYTENINKTEEDEKITSIQKNKIIKQLTDRTRYLYDHRFDITEIEPIEEDIERLKIKIEPLQNKTQKLNDDGSLKNKLNIVVEKPAALGTSGSKGSLIKTSVFDFSNADVLYVIGCKASCETICTTTCKNGCGSSCTSCTGGCSGCSGTCKTNCTGCTGNCVNTCSGNCTGSCSGCTGCTKTSS